MRPACRNETGHVEEEDHADEHAEEAPGRTQIAAEVARTSGIETAIAGPALIRETLTLHGTVVPDPQRVFRLRARYPGVVREVRKQIGEQVRRAKSSRSSSPTRACNATTWWRPPPASSSHVT